MKKEGRSREFFPKNSNPSKEELKKEFRRLVKEHHPDKGGDPETFMQVKAEYDAILQESSNETQIQYQEELAKYIESLPTLRVGDIVYRKKNGNMRAYRIRSINFQTGMYRVTVEESGSKPIETKVSFDVLDSYVQTHRDKGVFRPADQLRIGSRVHIMNPSSGVLETQYKIARIEDDQMYAKHDETGEVIGPISEETLRKMSHIPIG